MEETGEEEEERIRAHTTATELIERPTRTLAAKAGATCLSRAARNK